MDKKTKICAKCGIKKSLSKFTKRKKDSPRVRSRCKKCCLNDAKKYRHAYSESICKKRREWRANNPSEKVKARQNHLRATYNTTINIFNNALSRQNSRCLICGTTEPGGVHNQWSIDHDHKCCPGRESCGKCIRGLLCVFCNVGLGNFKDDPEVLRLAAEYLERNPIILIENEAKLNE